MGKYYMNALIFHRSQVYVDIDTHQNIAQMLQVQSIPSVFSVKDGQIIDSFMGLPENSEALQDYIEKSLMQGEEPQETNESNE